MARAGKVKSRYLVLPYRVLLRVLLKEIARPQRFARKLAVVLWHLKKVSRDSGFNSGGAPE